MSLSVNALVLFSFLAFRSRHSVGTALRSVASGWLGGSWKTRRTVAGRELEGGGKRSRVAWGFWSETQTMNRQSHSSLMRSVFQSLLCSHQRNTTFAGSFFGQEEAFRRGRAFGQSGSALAGDSARDSCKRRARRKNGRNLNGGNTVQSDSGTLVPNSVQVRSAKCTNV